MNEPVFMAGPKPMLTEFGIHQTLERTYHFNPKWHHLPSYFFTVFASSSSRGFNKRGESPLAFFTPMPRLTTCWILHFNWCCGVHRRTLLFYSYEAPLKSTLQLLLQELEAKCKMKERRKPNCWIGNFPQSWANAPNFYWRHKILRCLFYLHVFIGIFYRFMKISCYQHQNQDFFHMAHKKQTHVKCLWPSGWDPLYILHFFRAYRISILSQL